MKTFICTAMLTFAFAASQSNSDRPVALFDGKTLKGWEGNQGIFRVQDGAIVGGSLTTALARNECLCTTKSYADFELRMMVKLLGGDSANAGIQFRTRRIPNDNEVSGFQADMGVGYWGSLYDESRRKKTLTGPDAAKANEIVKRNDWNDYVIRAVGSHIQLSINGVQTVDYTEPDPSIEGTGIICVQIHAGPPSEAWYKDITVAEHPRTR